MYGYQILPRTTSLLTFGKAITAIWISRGGVPECNPGRVRRKEMVYFIYLAVKVSENFIIQCFPVIEIADYMNNLQKYTQSFKRGVLPHGLVLIHE